MLKNYLDQLWIDIRDPYNFQYLFSPIAQVPINLTMNNSHIDRFLKSPLCAKQPYKCQAKLKFEKFKWEIHYIMQIFHATYRKFLVVIDHLDYHPSQAPTNATRIKRSITYETYGYYHSLT